MARTFNIIAAALALSATLHAPASAQRLKLEFLPPDFPATNICRAPAEELGADETQVVEETGGADGGVDIKDLLSFVKRDIRRFKRLGADQHFEFIIDLISYRAELDPEFGIADEALARIDLYIDSGRIAEVEEKGLVEELAAKADSLSQSERVRLARYFMTGVGVAQDRARGERMLANEGFKGNANALLELLRLQLAGAELVEWFETPERTATLAFGGKLGQLNRGLCGRAEFIARAYIDGDLLEPNLELAFAWRKFAADQGGEKAAWRVVEHMLNADTGAFDSEEILRYLRLAMSETYNLVGQDVRTLVTSGARTPQQIRAVLERVHSSTFDRRRRSATPFFELGVSTEGEGVAETGAYRKYLEHITQFANVPGQVWTDLADEIILREGRWDGEDLAREALENAVAAGDPNAYVKLANLLLRSDRPLGDTSRSEALLLDAVEVHAQANAHRELDAYYRCTAPNAPFPIEANGWSAANKASHGLPISLDPHAFVQLATDVEPELKAHLHRLAMSGNSTALAGYLIGRETDVTVSDEALRHWARRVGASDKALELYALYRHALAPNAEASESTVDFARRAALAIGPAMAMDLAVVLVGNGGRDAEVAAEVRGLLEDAATRGEGASIRLLHRLDHVEDRRIYEKYADVIASRGDFLALMFAASFVDDETFDEYMARAISIMNCSSKDVSELADAFAARGHMEDAMHWLRVGLAIEHGHSMSRLRLDTYRLDQFDTPLATDESEGVTPQPLDRIRQAYHATSTPGAEGFDRDAAVKLLSEAMMSGDPARATWAFEEYTLAEAGIRRALAAELDLEILLRRGADGGILAAKHALGLHLREAAAGRSDLETSTKWLREAAEAGHAPAMVDYGYALAHGVGTAQDRKLALIWLRRAQGLMEPRAPALAGLVKALMDQNG